jgi:hypothetical protein
VPYPTPNPNSKFEHGREQFLLLLATLSDPRDQMRYRLASFERAYEAPPTTDMEELTEPPEIEVGDMVAAERFGKALDTIKPEHHRIARYHYIVSNGYASGLDWEKLIEREARFMKLDATYYAITLREATRAMEAML